MPAQVRLTKKELIDLIETTEASGCDVTCLRGLLAEVEEEERRRRLPTPEVPLRIEPLEAKRDLYRYALGLFVAGDVTEEVLESMAEYDAKYSVSKLQEELEERQLSTVGNKYILCARLLAHEKGWGKD